MASIRPGYLEDATPLQEGVEWGTLERVATTAMLSMILFVGSLFFLGGFALFSIESDANPWLLAVTSPFLRWDCAALKGTSNLVDALLRAPSILVPALLCSWTQNLNMPQRLTRLFALHLVWNLTVGFLLISLGVQLSPLF